MKESDWKRQWNTEQLALIEPVMEIFKQYCEAVAIWNNACITTPDMEEAIAQKRKTMRRIAVQFDNACNALFKKGIVGIAHHTVLTDVALQIHNLYEFHPVAKYHDVPPE